MSWNLFLKEMKRNRNRFLIWAVVIVLFIAFTSALLPTMIGSSAVTVSYLKIFPKAMLDAFGMDLSTWGSLLGMYATYHVFYSLLFGSIFAISLGGEILAKEEGRKTADFLLTRPLGRSEIVATKLVVLVVYDLCLNIVIAATGWVGLAAVGSQDWSRGAFLVLTLLFGTLGLFVSVLGKRGRSFTGVGTGIVLAAYFIDVFAKASDKVRDLGWVSPFRYVDTHVTASGYGLEWWRVLYLAGLSVILCALTFVIYRRKDILV
jgi:ABC-2 type transport system permease protein